MFIFYITYYSLRKEAMNVNVTLKNIGTEVEVDKLGILLS
jgi:hypothetical protein